MIVNKFRQTRVFFLAITVGLVFLVWPNLSFGADLRLSLPNSHYQVGDNFSATVQLVTPGESTNAVYGVVKFPTDRLQVVSISKTGSIFNLWVQEPTFSNTTGQVVFEGAILNPGFTGSAGRLLTINFKAKDSGVANLSFVEGSVLANDGQGTNILKKLNPATISISPKTESLSPKSEETQNVEKEKTLTSPIESPMVGDIVPPVLEVNEIKLPAGDRARFIFTSADQGSGIDYLEVRLDEAAVLNVPASNVSYVYNTPSLSSGSHILVVTAFDQAGNQTRRRLDFKISLPINQSSLLNWGKSLITVLSVLIPLSALIFILLFIIFSSWQRITLLKTTLRREMDGVEVKIHEAFELIKSNMQDQVLLLEKAKKTRSLTTIEKKLLRMVKSDLTETERLLKKEIDDIEKQIK